MLVNYLEMLGLSAIPFDACLPWKRRSGQRGVGDDL